MNRPWMPLYVGDYLGDTGHLTTAQHGAYLLLMMHYWRKGELPDDDRQLSKITKLPLRTWCEYRPMLQDFFYDGWKHKRIDAELARMMQVSAKRAIAGQKGGLGSALARMKLENSVRSRSSPLAAPSRAIAAPASAHAAVSVDHSHSHSHQSLSSDEASSAELPHPQGPPAPGRAQKPAVVVSPELAAYVARRTT
jgi:uncharacterized protein YdaU (DUF1376 family)